MADAFLSGNGGINPLNFQVVGGTSTPSNPAENTVWVNTSTPVTCWNFSTSEPCHRSKNKNLLTYPYYRTTRTENGITFTDNKDGTITANGTASAQTTFALNHTSAATNVIWLEPGTYTASGCPSGGSTTTHFIQFHLMGDDSYQNDVGSGRTFTITKGNYIRFYLVVRSGVTVNNVIFKPQLEIGSTATSFVKGDATGQVWIQTSAPSIISFNALKKNNVAVYPKAANQYVNGAWVSKSLLVYKASAWRNRQYTIAPDINRVWTNTKSEVSSTESETVIILSLKSSSNGSKSTSSSYTEIDLTGYNTLYIKGSHSVNNTSGSDQNWTLHLADTSNAAVSTIFNRGVIPEKTDVGYQAFEKTIDISSLSGVHRLRTYGETWSTISIPHIVTITDAYVY